MTNPDARLTIGLLTTIGLEDQYQIGILRGINAAVLEQNVHLVVFGGGKLDSPEKDQANANIIYDLATAPTYTVDAVIVFSGTNMTSMGPEQRAEFRAKFRIPMVSIGLELSDACSVLLNNDSGIRDIITHLISVHGYQRIAFIQGPEGNYDAKQRFDAYLNALKTFDIPYDPQLVVAGNFQDKDGAAAIKVLLDERQVTVDAIVAANDNMAMGVLNELRTRAAAAFGDIAVVYDDIAVVGFDDVDDAEAIIPALTTVRQPLYEQGRQAVDLALAMVRGERVQRKRILDPELVVRHSCGCALSSAINVKTQSPGLASTHPPEAIQQHLIASKSAVLEAILEVVPTTRNSAYLSMLYDSFVNDLFDDKSAGRSSRFITLLDTLTSRALLENAQIHRWHEILTVLRRELNPLLGLNLQLRTYAEDLWQQARILTSEAIRQSESNRRLQVKLQALALDAIGVPVIANSDDLANLTSVMAEQFPVLGIKSCYLAVFEDNSHEWVSLAFSYIQAGPPSESSLSGNRRRTLSNDLIQQILQTTNRRQSLLVQAMYLDSTQFGILVLEIERPEPYVYEALRKQFSNSYHTTFLMRALAEKQRLLEQALEDIKTAQSLMVHHEKMNALGQMVAGVAHEINNPLAFISSNVHTLGQTFDEYNTAYNDLEHLVMTSNQSNAVEALKQIRAKNGLDYIIEDTPDLISETLNGLKRVKTIVEELRKFSRLDEAEFKVSNLRENIESSLLVARGTLGQRISVDIDIDPNLAFPCAAAQLNQVFLNMIINAGQAIQGKGTIYISAHEDKDQVTIQIRDTGSGMPASVMAHIFDPFFTTKPVGVGTGLGLSISHKIIVDGHKGSIAVASIPDEGTTFTIVLPKAAQLAPS